MLGIPLQLLTDRLTNNNIAPAFFHSLPLEGNMIVTHSNSHKSFVFETSTLIIDVAIINYMLHISFSPVLSCWMMAAPPLLPQNSAIPTPRSLYKNLSISSRWERFYIKDWISATEDFTHCIMPLTNGVFMVFSINKIWQTHSLSCSTSHPQKVHPAPLAMWWQEGQ